MEVQGTDSDRIRENLECSGVKIKIVDVYQYDLLLATFSPINSAHCEAKGGRSISLFICVLRCEIALTVCFYRNHVGTAGGQ